MDATAEKSFELPADKKPMKAKNLKVIDHLGTYYATFDGTKSWKVEKWLYRLLSMCDGKSDTNQIAERIARISGFDLEEIRVGLRPVFEELAKNGLVVFV